MGFWEELSQAQLCWRAWVPRGMAARESQAATSARPDPGSADPEARNLVLCKLRLGRAGAKNGLGGGSWHAALNFSCVKVIIGTESRMALRVARSGTWKGRSYRLVGEAVGAMPVPRRRKKRVDRGVLSADEIATRIMTLIRHGGGRRSIRGITIVYVGSLGTEPNCFARPQPPKISPASRKRFVTALARVRQEYDLLVDLHAGDTSMSQLDDFLSSGEDLGQRLIQERSTSKATLH
jgi:hypothetical protein